MPFVDLFWRKGPKCQKTGDFRQILLLHKDLIKIACFSWFSAFSSKQIHKMHKITSDFCHMRKFLTKKFWSQGTSPGSLGPGSREALGLGACRLQISVIWGPYEPPVPLVFHEQAKSLKPVPSRSELVWTWNWLKHYLDIITFNGIHIGQTTMPGLYLTNSAHISVAILTWLGNFSSNADASQK